jgi:hypothetical protein
MYRFGWVLVLAAAWLPADGKSSEAKPAKKGPDPRIAALIGNLSSEDYFTRELAMQQLEALGPAARDSLTKAVMSGDAEVRHRALELAARLARRQESAEVLKPRCLRVVYREVPLSAALVDFSQVSGGHLALDGASADKLAERRITVDTGYTTFWDALAQFCRAAGLTEKDPEEAPVETQRNYSSGVIFAPVKEFWIRGQRAPGPVLIHPGGEIKLIPGKQASLPTFLTGGLRIRALPPGTSLGNGTSGPSDGEALLVLELAAEPGLGWQGVNGLRVEKALDDRGQLLAQTFAYLGVKKNFELMDIDQSWMFDGRMMAENSGGQRVPLWLRKGGRPAGRLTELTGTASVRLLTTLQPVATIANVLRAAGQTNRADDGTLVKITEIKQEGEGRLKIGLDLENPVPSDGPVFFGRGWRHLQLFGLGGPEEDYTGVRQVLCLLDSQGHLVRMTRVDNLSDGSAGPECIRLSLTFQAAPGQAEPSRLILQGRRSLVLEVPFSLREVPLR